MLRRHSACVFLCLIAVAVFLPLAPSAGAHGDCCRGGKEGSRCSEPSGGFSLCCLHAASVLPALPPAGYRPVWSAAIALLVEGRKPAPDPRGILHVPRLS